MNTVTFNVDALRPCLDVLFLRTLETREDRALCRVDVSGGAIRIQSMFRRGAAGVAVPAKANEPFAFALPASRIEALKYLDGEVEFKVSDKEFRYASVSGTKGSGEAHPAVLVPGVEPPRALGSESGPCLRAVLDLCAPFGGGAVVRRGGVTLAGNGQQSIHIEMAATYDWVIARDAVLLARDYLRHARGTVEVLGDASKFGIADRHSWIVWPRSAAPEVIPVRCASAVGEGLQIATEQMAACSAWINAEVGEEEWFDLSFGDVGAKISWRSRGQSIESGFIPFRGEPVQRRVSIYGASLRHLVENCVQEQTGLRMEQIGEAVIVTSTELREIEGQRATVRRTIVASAADPDRSGGVEIGRLVGEGTQSP